MKNAQEWGLYKSVVRLFSIRVPVGWSVTELEDQLEILSDSADVSVIVSSFSKSTHEAVDVVAQLRRFLDSSKVQAEAKIRPLSNTKACVEYSDVDGALWYVMVKAQPKGFLLATCNTGVGSGHQNFRIGRDVVETLKPFEREEL